MGNNRTKKVKTRKAGRLKHKFENVQGTYVHGLSSRINQLIREGKVKVYMSYGEFKNRKTKHEKGRQN